MTFIRETAHKIKMISDCCGLETNVFLTNKEIWSNVFIEQWCEKC